MMLTISSACLAWHLGELIPPISPTFRMQSAPEHLPPIHTHPWAGANRQWSGLDSPRQTSVG